MFNPQLRLIPVLILLAIVLPGTAFSAGSDEGRAVRVSDVATLDAAVKDAMPGDVITLAPGRYSLERVRIRRLGAKGRPITLRADKKGSVFLRSRGVVLFDIRAAYWTFENFDIRGQCIPQKKCEHAFQLNGDADNVIIRNNRIRDFNASIKSNGAMVTTADGGEVRKYPDHVRIVGNAIYNSRPRRTNAPVTLIDVVGGRGWLVRGNLIADFEKAGGNKISYAMFLKGN
jgi:hypothetical protein